MTVIEVSYKSRRKVRISTSQHVIDKPNPDNAELPLRQWTVEVHLLDEKGNEHPANCFVKVVYNLHPSFANPTQTFHTPPFRCSNEGWGEFEMLIDLYTTEKSGKHSIPHDLNFQQQFYEVTHTVPFKNPSQQLQNILRETGPIAADEERKQKKGDSKKKRAFDLNKIADALTSLDEDNLLQVIQIIHDGKDDNTYIQNNVEAGEFSIDLFTMPDALSKQLWDFFIRIGAISV